MSNKTSPLTQGVDQQRYLCFRRKKRTSSTPGQPEEKVKKKTLHWRCLHQAIASQVETKEDNKVEEEPQHSELIQDYLYVTITPEILCTLCDKNLPKPKTTKNDPSGPILEISYEEKNKHPRKKNQRDATKAGKDKPEKESIKCLVAKKPILILYLVGKIPVTCYGCDMSLQFCNGNRQKLKTFDQNFIKCLLTKDVWVFAPEDMKQYLENLWKSYSSKENKGIFFFHTGNNSTSVYEFLRKLSDTEKCKLVLLILNGDKETCQQTVNAAREKKTPAVVIKGSGGYADELLKENESKKSNQESNEDSQKSHRDSQKGASKQEETKSGTEDTKAASGTVFDLDSSLGTKRSLCLSILDAICKDDDKKKQKGNESDTDRQDKIRCLKLALSWECTERAEKMRSNIGKVENLNKLMIEALKQEKLQSVRILMDCGVNLRDLPCEELYMDDSEIFTELEKSKTSDISRISVRKSDQSETSSDNKTKDLKELKDVLQDLLDDISSKSSNSSSSSSKAEESTCCCGSKTSEKQAENPNTLEQNGELLLFLWALLHGKFQVAEFLWKEVQDHMTAALIACLLLRAMRSRVVNDIQFEDEEREMIIYIEVFEGLAVKTLNNLYKEDESETYKLLARVQNTDVWSDVTCLEIADRARCRKFIAQEPCQNFADHIWRGKDPFKKKESDTDKWVVLTRIVFFISSIFVVVPRAFMEFSQNKRGPAQLWYATTRFCVNWPRTWEDPSFKFYVGWFCFFGFLLLYAYVLMVRIPPEDLETPEVALLIWFLTMYIEEFRVCWALSLHKSKRIKSFLLYQLGLLNVTNYYLAMFGIILWLFDPDSFALHAVLSLNFISFIIRLFQYLSINSQLGPKVFMIKRMVKEIILFSVILMIIFFTYGVIKYSIDNGGEGVVNSTVVINLPVEAFWLMLADRPDDSKIDSRGDEDPSVIFRGLLRVAYLLFTSILLINVLIAAFSYVFEVIQNQKEDVRRYQKFEMIVRFSLGSPLPPPLSLIYLFKFVWDLCKGQRKGPLFKFRKDIDEDEQTSLLNWAKVTMEAYSDEPVKTIEERVEETMRKSFVVHDQKEDKKTESPEGVIRRLIEDTQSLHESILRNIFVMHSVGVKLAGKRTVCDPCIVYKRCVVCGKLPRYAGAMHYDLTTLGRQRRESVFLRQNTMPLQRPFSEPGERH